MRALARTAVLLLAAITASCDRMPGDPLDDPETAALAARMSQAVIGDGPLPSLFELADFTATRVDGEDRELADAYHALRASADAALRSGDRQRVEATATAARNARLEVVVAGLGRFGVAELIGQAQHRVRQLRVESADSRAARLERMSRSAADMLARARVHLLDGNTIEALDLSAHAIDLINVVDARLANQ